MSKIISALILFYSFISVSAYAEEVPSILRVNANEHGKLLDIKPHAKIFTPKIITAKPAPHFMVHQWKLDGKVVQTGGINYMLRPVPGQHSLDVSFVPQHIMYVGASDSNLYYSLDDGATWQATPTHPNDHNAIDEVFATSTTVYVVTTSKYVFSSKDNGVTWKQSAHVPDYGRIRSIFVTPEEKIYVGTSLGNLFYSTNGGASWTATLQAPSPGHFINSIQVRDNELYVGSSNGYVLYSRDGMIWTDINGSPDHSAIRSLYLAKDKLYVNTSLERVYVTPLAPESSWIPIAQLAYSLFVSPDENKIRIGTQNGHVYALNPTHWLGYVGNALVNSIFVLD